MDLLVSLRGFSLSIFTSNSRRFPRDHLYNFGGYNVDEGYYDWRVKVVRRCERVEEDRGEHYERVDSDNGDNDEDKRDDVNGKGLGDEGDNCNVRDSEDWDDIPSIHDSTFSLLHYEQRVQKEGFDTHKNPITKKKKKALSIWNNIVSWVL